MNSIDQQFTDKLYANYEATAKYAAIENAVSHNGLLTSLENVAVRLKTILCFPLI